MKKNYNIFKPFFFFLFFLSLAIGSEFYFLSDRFSDDKLNSFEKQFHSKEIKTLQLLNDVVSVLKDSDSISNEQLYVKLKFLRETFDDDEISFLILNNGVPYFWSDNVISLDPDSDFEKEKFVKLSNCYCYQIKDTIKSFEIYGSIILKYNYN